MKATPQALCFFLGYNTPQGFVSRFDQLGDVDDGWRIVILKGGPGSGKSTILRRIYQELGSEFPETEVIHCASDPDSIDAVMIPGLKVAIADGTAPHVIEPRFPGAVESIVDLSTCWDDDKLIAKREEIIRLVRACSLRHEQCCRFLGAGALLAGDTYKIGLDCLNTAKLAAYAERLAERELKSKVKKPGSEKIRLVSAVTSQGIRCSDDSIKALCKRIYLINDDYGAVSRLLLHKLRTAALAAGLDIITSYCPMAPYDKIEHLLIPSLSLGFVTSNRMHDLSLAFDPYRIVNSKRFMDAEALRKYKRRIAFNRKGESKMIAQATLLLEEAKTLHDELEAHYVAAMDFTKVEALTQELLAKLKAMV